MRLQDNHGLYLALTSGRPVIPLFIFDTTILHELKDKQDARVTFIHQTLMNMQAELGKRSSSLIIRTGNPLMVWRQLLEEFTIDQVYTNSDYEPYASKRDQQIKALLDANGIDFINEVIKDQKTGVILTSGYFDEASTMKAFAHRNYRFIAKPYVLETLLRCIKDVLGTRK